MEQRRKQTDHRRLRGKPQLRENDAVQCVHRLQAKGGQLARRYGGAGRRGNQLQRKAHQCDGPPGIYSLTSYTIEEIVTRRCIEETAWTSSSTWWTPRPLERNLYLTLQLLELKKPVILALNMMDIIEERGMEIDLHRLPEMLGHIPVVPVSARKRTGLDVLMHAVVHHYEEEPQGIVVHYDSEMEDKIQRTESLLREKYRR